ncbi:hypothetical protein EDF60_1740 [Leucobacter luti]|uniref:hypothetical protein n=1 Tax=Leucobacter luti TaxID=340320 RepID=UPI00104CC7A3|nr:hypothetical protein [Leucobacter luti]MCW2287090.1 hypothetical protein [Leucobacter luti]TCK41314.1 hypothetical protein EDF60_1740 [Leucobacter luti]
MSVNDTVYRRVLRRETHAARTGPAVSVAVVLAVVLTAAVVVIVWGLVDQDFRAATFGAVASARPLPGVLLGIGVGLLVLAVLLIFAAIAPGRRSRRARTTDRVGLVLDDGVLADSAAARIAAASGLSMSQVSVTAGKRVVTAVVTPTSGVQIDEAAVRKDVLGALSDAGFAASARVKIAERGVVS